MHWRFKRITAWQNLPNRVLRLVPKDTRGKSSPHPARSAGYAMHNTNETPLRQEADAGRGEYAEAQRAVPLTMWLG
jgi:hypothetical protein